MRIKNKSFCVSVVLCVGSGLATGWSPVQRLCIGLRIWKGGQGPKGYRAIEREREREREREGEIKQVLIIENYAMFQRINVWNLQMVNVKYKVGRTRHPSRYVTVKTRCLRHGAKKGAQLKRMRLWKSPHTGLTHDADISFCPNSWCLSWCSWCAAALKFK
jgi:hypothetical protein